MDSRARLLSEVNDRFEGSKGEGVLICMRIKDDRGQKMDDGSVQLFESIEMRNVPSMKCDAMPCHVCDTHPSHCFGAESRGILD